MKRRISVWDIVRFAFISFWIAWSIMIPEDGLFSSWPFYLALFASIITLVLQLQEDARLEKLVEEHEDRIDEWRKTVKPDQKDRNDWESIGRYTWPDQRPALHAKILKPFLSELPSWSDFVENIDQQGKGVLQELAEWVFYAQRGKVSDRYTFPSGHMICELFRKITPEMREDFFLAVDEELRRHGVESEPIVMVDHCYYLLRKYIKSVGHGKTKNDSFYNWVSNCHGGMIPNFILRDIH